MGTISISIVIPTFNRAKLIKRAIDSLLNQTKFPDEIIIVDDGSTDNTENVVSTYLSSYPFIKYLKLPENFGPQYARNVGIRKSGSNFILLLDSDNSLDKTYCEKASHHLIKNPSVEILTNFSKVINEVDQKENSFSWITKGNILKDILQVRTYVDSSSALIKKDKLIQIGKLDEKCPSFQEWDTHIRLASISHYDCIEEYLTIYYKHNENRISNSQVKEVEGRYYILKKHKDLWLEQTSKKVYLHQLFLTYCLALKYRNEFFSNKIAKEIRRLSPLFLFAQKCFRIGSHVKRRLFHNEHHIKQTVQ